jgi:hypothetical protein
MFAILLLFFICDVKGEGLISQVEMLCKSFLRLCVISG